MGEELSLSVKAETEIKRFLHYGSIIGIYSPTSGHSAAPIFPDENLTHFKNIEHEKTVDAIISLIKRVLADEFFIEPNAILFALTYLIKIGNARVKKEAYRIVPSLTKTSKDFLLFNIYLKHHEKKLGISSGFGKGWMKTTKKWYDSKSLLEFVDLLTASSFESWNHLKILNMGRIIFDDDHKKQLYQKLKSRNPDLDSLLGIDADMTAAVNHAKQVLNLRHSGNDDEQLKKIMVNCNFKIDQYPNQSLLLHDVWLHEINAMDAETVIENLTRMGKLKHLSSRDVVRAIENKLDIQELNSHPAFIFLVLREIERAPKRILIRKWIAKAKTDPPPEVGASGSRSYLRRRVPIDRIDTRSEHPHRRQYVNIYDFHLFHYDDPIVCSAMNPKQRSLVNHLISNPIRLPITTLSETLINLCLTTMKGLAATGLKYLIVVNTSAVLACKGCKGTKYVSVQEAMMLIILCILNAEPEESVDLITVVSGYTIENDYICRIHATKDDTFQTLTRKFCMINQAKNPAEYLEYSFNFDKVFQWTMSNDFCYDVIISLSGDEFYGSHTDTLLNQYRSDINFDTRLIICSLNGMPSITPDMDEAMFLITGFNENVCKLIEGYCRKAL